MTRIARLAEGEALGDRVLRCASMRAQRRLARWTAPAMLAEIDEFIAHERRHRALFAAETARRGDHRDEQMHHDLSAAQLRGGLVQRGLGNVVAAATEAVIWIGMRRRRPAGLRLR